MQAPVTQSTGPDRIRQPAWYFRRERGMNCSRIVRQRLGKTPTEPCGVPSGFLSPKPTIPGGPQAASRSRDPLDDLADQSTFDLHIRIQHEQPGASGQSPAGVDAHGETAVIRPDQEPEAGGRIEPEAFRDRIWRGVVHDHDLELARRELGLGHERGDEPQDVGPAVVVDDDDRQPRSHAGQTRSLLDLRRVHAEIPITTPGERAEADDETDLLESSVGPADGKLESRSAG